MAASTDVALVDGIPAPTVTDDSFGRLRHLATTLRDVDHIDDDGDVVTVSDFSAIILAHAVLSAFGIIPESRKLVLRDAPQPNPAHLDACVSEYFAQLSS